MTCDSCLDLFHVRCRGCSCSVCAVRWPKTKAAPIRRRKRSAVPDLGLHGDESSGSINTRRSETILSPFAGIGSEGVGAIRHGRRYIGIELKASYWSTAADNLRRAEYEAGLPTLFDEAL